MSITVSIVMLVYNHGRFLAQALDSVLMQQVNFDYELIVGEDHSPDNSGEVLKSYEEKFGASLVPLYREKNLGVLRNMEDCLNRCRGKYIAFLEGDDFWTDPCKLQKQVEFLESHPEYAAVYTGYVRTDIHGQVVESIQLWEEFHRFTLADFERYDLPGQTGTMMISAEKVKSSMKRYRQLLPRYAWVPQDRLCVAYYLSIGQIGVLPEIMSAYRYYCEEDGTNWSSRHEEGDLKHLVLKVYFILIGLERFAHKLGLSCDLYVCRRDCFGRVNFFRQCGIIGFRREMAQLVLMALLEPRKLRLLRDRRLLFKAPQEGKTQ